MDNKMDLHYVTDKHTKRSWPECTCGGLDWVEERLGRTVPFGKSGTLTHTDTHT